MLKNAHEAGIYRRGLVTILAPLNRREYVDFVYEILKNTPRDSFGLRKPRGWGDYRLLRSDLYRLAELDEDPNREVIRIEFANPDLVDLRDKKEVIRELMMHMDILDIKIKKFHKIECVYLVYYRDSYIFSMPISFFPGEVLTSNAGWEFEVVECRDKKTNDGYIVELKALDDPTEDQVSQITTLARDSNSTILMS